MTASRRLAPLPLLLIGLAALAVLALIPWVVQAQSQEVTPTAAATGANPPAKPTNLQASAVHESVALTWTASTDQTVTHYAILRRNPATDASQVFHVIESNAGPETSYTDGTVSASTTYIYRAKSVSPTGVSQWSGYVKADTPAAPDSTLEPTPTPTPTPTPSPEPVLTPTPEDLRPTGLKVSFALHPENADPKSIWSDGETLWVGDDRARKVFAYRLWDKPGTAVSEYGTRDPGRDVPSLGQEDFYVTGHGPRLYVAEEALDGASRDVFGYDLTSLTRLEDRDFVYGGPNVAGGVLIVRGMATDGRHLWITDTTSHAHAFRLFDDPETPEDEYGRPDASRKLTMPGRGQLRGLFTDGRTMWGVRLASHDASVRSVKLSDGTEAGFDFPLHEENDHAYGIWSDGETFYVVDADDDMIYTYHGVSGVVRPTVEDAETAAALVGNTTQPGAAGHDLGSTGAKRAQAFTTGNNNAGYALASIGIEFDDVSDPSSAPPDLEATLNADGGGVPGDALCTLAAPASLSERSVNTFTAPASGTTCPALVKETTYFVVVERVRVTGSGAIAVSGTASGSEDTGAAEGWSIADGSATYSPQAAAQGWASDAFSYKIEVRGSSINNPAAGEATVTGTAQVGETLTADTSGIADADGLTNVSYAYQWIRTDGGTDAGIAGATDSTYTLTGDDQGKTIKLKVTFNDDKGNSETLAIVAAADVGESEQKPQFLVSNLGVGVGGAAGIQRPLSAARSGFAQAFTTGAKTDGYAMGSVGIQVSQFADESTVGDHLQVTINGVASEGEPGDAHCTLTNPSSFSAPGVIAFAAPAGAGSCPQLATETTYFVVIEWVNPSGTDAFALIPQTHPTEETAATEEDPGGADGWSIADESHYLAVSSDARTWTAYDETASFKIEVKEGAVTAAKPNSEPAGLPTISGTPQVDETLTADTSAIADEDGLDDVSYSYQWVRSDNGADNDIAGETDSTYTLVLADRGKTIKVRVTFADDADNAETLTSVATEAVAAAPNREATGAPTISGTPQVDETLTATTSAVNDEDGLKNVSYSYQWMADDVNIDGATGATYVLANGDAGKTIRVSVSFTDDRDNAESLTSVATETVAAAPNREATGAPTISGTPQVGQTLTADTSAIADEDGLTNVSYRYQWMAGGLDVDGATGSSYELTSSEQGQTITVRVSFADDADNTESLTSAATETVAQAPSPLTVSLENAATSHNGTDVFTFEIRFSEQFGLSYKTLRDHAFTEVGGEVKKAQRMDSDSDTPNTWWLITVEPDGNGDVTVTLPATTDCTDDGAICTEDGRMLSNSLELTVSGPGQ